MAYDVLVVGAGLFGSVVAHEAAAAGKKVLVIDKRNTTAGNVYTYDDNGIIVHKYGPHIFHTNDTDVWNYVNHFAAFNRYTNCPIANYNEELYSLPFNMYTFNKMWGITTPFEAHTIIERQRSEIKDAPKNLEEQAIFLVGRDIYEKLIKGYTEKQWGRDCRDLPVDIIKRLPVRFSYNNDYFDAKYQGIPIKGYTNMILSMLNGIDCILGVDYFENKSYFSKISDLTIFTGSIDAYYDYCYGELQYRSLKFDTKLLDMPDYQGNAVVNYTSIDVPYTRVVEHKWFNMGMDIYDKVPERTVITREYSIEWSKGDEPYYPINDARNTELYSKYKALADNEKNVVFGGRLGYYKYLDMDAVVKMALNLSEQLFKKRGFYYDG